MPTRLFRHSLAMFARERGGAERAEGARSHAKKTLVQILYGSVAYQRVKNQGRVRSTEVSSPPGRETGMSKAKAAPIQGCTEENAPL